MAVKRLNWVEWGGASVEHTGLQSPVPGFGQEERSYVHQVLEKMRVSAGVRVDGLSAAQGWENGDERG